MTAQKLILSLVLSTGLSMTASSAFAQNGPLLDLLQDRREDRREDRGAAAPELAGHGAPSALALIAGGAAIVISRRRRSA
ncbi:MAG: hypothetical protein ABUL62_31090 [Myxococcales bacterium]